MSRQDVFLELWYYEDDLQIEMNEDEDDGDSDGEEPNPFAVTTISLPLTTFWTSRPATNKMFDLESGLMLPASNTHKEVFQAAL